MASQRYLFVQDRAEETLPSDAHHLGGKFYAAARESTEPMDLGTRYTRDRELSAPVHYDQLQYVEVGGTGMDYHGHGLPTASIRRLARRARDEGNPAMDGEGILVGLVDGAFTDHPWLDGGYLASPNEFETFVPNDDGPFALQPFAGHATFITGLILQQAPAAGVWVERVLNENGRAFAIDVARAAHTLVDRGVHILNLSLGCFDRDDDFKRIMQELVDDLLAKNPKLVIVAAAGNLEVQELADIDANSEDGTRSEFWPAACDRVVGVGAVSGDDPIGLSTWADWSNYGPWVRFAANGTDLLSTYLDRLVERKCGDVDFKGWARWSGTSFSAAIVSGAIARTITENPGVSALGAVEILESSPDAYTDDLQKPVIARRFWDDHLTAKAATRSKELQEWYESRLATSD